MSSTILAINYLLHLLATVVWIGGLSLMTLVITPGLAKALDDDAQRGAVLDALYKRMTPLSNLSLVILIVTGMFQMVGDTHYDGFLLFTNTWAKAIVLKHVAVGAMVLVGFYIQSSLRPAQARAALLATRANDPTEANRLRGREQRLMRVNVVLSILVLFFTAIATAQ